MKNPRPKTFDVQKFIADVESGLDDYQLAEKYNVSLKTISNRRTKYTSVKKKRKRKFNLEAFIQDTKQGMSDAELAKKYRMALATVTAYRLKHTGIKRQSKGGGGGPGRGGKTRKFDKDAFILDIRLGYSSYDLGRKYGLTEDTAKQYRSRFMKEWRKKGNPKDVPQLHRIRWAVDQAKKAADDLKDLVERSADLDQFTLEGDTESFNTLKNDLIDKGMAQFEKFDNLLGQSYDYEVLFAFKTLLEIEGYDWTRWEAPSDVLKSYTRFIKSLQGLKL